MLLDVDGTLLDSNVAHTNAWLDALAENGFPQSFERVRPLIGMGADKVLPTLGIEKDSRAGKSVSRRVGEIFKEKYAGNLVPFRGTRDLLLHMKKLGLKLSVATSARSSELHELLHLAKIEDLIDTKSDSSDAGASKPDPDIIQSAVERAKLPPESLVMIGDTPYDVEAAHRAGVAAIVLRCGGWWSDSDFGADVEIFDDPAHLLAELDRSSIGKHLDRAATRRV